MRRGRWFVAGVVVGWSAGPLWRLVRAVRQANRRNARLRELNRELGLVEDAFASVNAAIRRRGQPG